MVAWLIFGTLNLVYEHRVREYSIEKHGIHEHGICERGIRERGIHEHVMFLGFIVIFMFNREGKGFPGRNSNSIVEMFRDHSWSCQLTWFQRLASGTISTTFFQKLWILKRLKNFLMIFTKSMCEGNQISHARRLIYRLCSIWFKRIFLLLGGSRWKRMIFLCPRSRHAWLGWVPFCQRFRILKKVENF